jgi:hypothetical protein
MPYVYHMFMGSWKKTTPFGLTVFIRKLSSTLHKQQQQQQQTPKQQQHEHQSNRSAAGTVVGGVAASNGSSPASLHHNTNPRRPILDEQIAQHRLQQQQQQQQLLKQHGKLHSLQMPDSAQPLAAASSGSPAAAATVPPPPPQQQQAGFAAAGAAAGPRTPSTRKLRSSQVLLVRGAAMSVPNMQGLWLEPDVPSKNLGELHTVFLLVVAAVLFALCKRRGGGACTGLWAAAQDGMKRVRSSSGAPLRSTLTRPLSRTHLGMGSGGSALLINTSMPPTPAGAGAASSSSGSSDGSLSPVPEAVCYSSSQSLARGSGHKRSWGSGSNFQL